MIRGMLFDDYDGRRDGGMAERSSTIGAQVAERACSRAESGLKGCEILSKMDAKGG